ncbi:MAG TPA: methylated-DNA--[protein]-cysteine S-methyltransferase [Solirubrobacteraceae bacterium]|nr:methylated-DNA--[protein]-cysteine S-methyltransferase [Solirubrobacteraceae bacterium]
MAMNDSDPRTEHAANALRTEEIEQALAPDVDPAVWRRITEALAARAAAEDLLDVAVERHDSPFGPLLLAATREGIVRLGFPEEEDGFLDEIARRVSGRVLRAPRPSLSDARHQLDEYFARARTGFDVALDWRLTRGFRRDVLAVTAAIPYGQTASYGEVAARAGSPRAARAAGTALATNPLPILVPCHRVVRGTGVIGPYRGGTEAKRRLLALEAAGGAPGA